MTRSIFLQIFLGIFACLSVSWVKAEDPYRYFTLEVTYGTISPLGVNQRFRFIFTFLWGILINGQFPGPTLDCITNDNVIVDVINNLDEPFLITWSVFASFPSSSIRMELNRGSPHGKMECLERIAQSLQTQTGHTRCK
ncbi:hypothetical protein HYC85_002442 [Camellia sinensis]|uniref:Plastocyanin-like domain-containing protein n=1 Tax=Camellia sinensis TaxID=4442 RepID=A0A7J7I8A4_CAMSI|nr:hypothetical protein HYC85_002442 [Camellia sinensis]